MLKEIEPKSIVEETEEIIKTLFKTIKIFIVGFLGLINPYDTIEKGKKKRIKN